MKILVTGGAGFIASHVVDAYIKEGYDVVVVDNLSSGNKSNLNSKAKFYNADITDVKAMDDIFKKEKPTIINHHAAQIKVQASIRDPMNDAEINIKGSLNLLELCRKYQIKYFIYASSGGAGYGEPEKIPCPESHPIRPLSPYGITKHTVEHFLFYYHKTYGINYIVLKYANVYGPRQDPDGEAGVISIFAGACLKGKQPKIFGDGKNTRDYVFVEDVAKANVLAAKKLLSDEIFAGEYNIGTGKETDVNYLAKKIKDLTGSKIRPAYAEAVNEVHHIALDIKLAKKELGWQPLVDIDIGLKKTVDYFKYTMK